MATWLFLIFSVYFHIILKFSTIKKFFSVCGLKLKGPSLVRSGCDLVHRLNAVALVVQDLLAHAELVGELSSVSGKVTKLHTLGNVSPAPNKY